MTDTKTTEQLQAEIDPLRYQLEAAQDKLGAHYLLMECENCDEEIYYGVCVTTLEHNGLPAIPFDTAAQTNFECPKCGADNYTGDFEVFCEGGNDQDDEPEGEDDEDEDED